MEIKTKADLIQYLEAHLSKNTGRVSVIQDTNKRKKENARYQKFVWSKDDILKESGSIETFIDTLPQFGFTSGAILQIKRMEGVTAKIKGETTLTFPDAPKPETSAPQSAQKPSVMEQIEKTQTSTASQSSPPAQYQGMGNPGLGFVAVQQHEVVSMKVKAERYDELVDKVSTLKEDLADCKADLRTEKIARFDAERKLETLEDKKEFEKTRALAEKENAFDKLAKNEAVVNGLGTLLASLPEMIKKPQAVGMGNPIANLSEAKQQFAAQLQNIPDELIPILFQTSQGLISNDEFQQYVITGLNQIQSNS